MSVLESPANTNHDFNADHSIYNMTMTYRLDSDIVWSYAKIEDVITGQQTAPIQGKSMPVWRTPDVNFSGSYLKFIPDVFLLKLNLKIPHCWKL
jgi:alpha-1,3-fucosyltransferase